MLLFFCLLYAGDDEDITVDEIEEQKVLAGKTFRFVGFVPEQVCQLNELISHFGGKEGTSNDLVDFVVTPMNYEELVGNAKNVVSHFLLFKSNSNNNGYNYKFINC